MSVAWIKMRVDLAQDPRVSRLASRWKRDIGHAAVRLAAAVGMLHRTWALFDAQTADGFIPHVDSEWLDTQVGLEGWAEDLAAIGWIVVSPDGITLPGFEKHNGESAKKRDQAARRKAAERERSRQESRTERDIQRDEKRTPSYSYSLSSSSSVSYPSEGGERREQPLGLGARLRGVLDAELEPITDRALAAIGRLDRQTRQARADAGKPPEISEAAWRKAIQAARDDVAAFELRVDLTEERSAMNLQALDAPDAPNGGGTPQPNLGARANLQRANDEALQRLLEREARGELEPIFDLPTSNLRRLA